MVQRARGPDVLEGIARGAADAPDRRRDACGLPPAARSDARRFGPMPRDPSPARDRLHLSSVTVRHQTVSHESSGDVDFGSLTHWIVPSGSITSATSGTQTGRQPPSVIWR